MLGVDNFRGESMEPPIGLSGMMDGFARHYPFPGQSGYPAWPVMPGMGVPGVPQADYLHVPPPHKIDDTQNSRRTGSNCGHNGRKARQQTDGGGGGGGCRGGAVSPPPSRERFSYTRYQLEMLNKIYVHIRYPNSMQKQLVAKRVGIRREQVKIWFQNRRRKDITGKRSRVDDVSCGPQQVPTDIMESVLQELLKYENDPKGKKVIDSQKEYQKKVTARKRSVESTDDDVTPHVAKRQRHESGNSTANSSTSSKSSLPIIPSELPEVYFANEPSPQCSVTSDGPTTTVCRPSPLSRSAQSASFSSDSSAFQIISVESGPDIPYSSDANSVVSPAPLTIVPSAEQLDMNAPPNAVALPLEKAKLERPRSLESPLEAQIGKAAKPLSPPNTDQGLELSIRANENSSEKTREKPPPNTVAPPSQKINFLAEQLAKKQTNTNLPQQAKNTEPSHYQNPSPLEYTQHQNLAQPLPISLYNNTPFSPWNQSGGTFDKGTFQEQLYSNVMPQHTEPASYSDSLSSHYDKFYTPYMIGLFPEQGFVSQVQQPFMLPNLNYPTPFNNYDTPSDLSIKKSYQNS